MELVMQRILSDQVIGKKDFTKCYIWQLILSLFVVRCFCVSHTSCRHVVSLFTITFNTHAHTFQDTTRTPFNMNTQNTALEHAHRHTLTHP